MQQRRWGRVLGSTCFQGAESLTLGHRLPGLSPDPAQSPSEETSFFNADKRRLMEKGELVQVLEQVAAGSILKPIL